MSVDEYTYKFLDFLQHVGQAYEIEQKKAKRYEMRLYSKYSSLILPVERVSFYTIMDATRKIEANAIIQGTVRQ